MMRPWLMHVVVFLVMAVVGHVAATVAFPRAIMSVAVHRIIETAGGANTLFHGPRVTPQSQRIVRPSPDLAYSICVLDLSQGPVRVRVARGSAYASAAFYADNTDNIATLNDRSFGPEGAQFLVLARGMPPRAALGETIVMLPSNKGLLLVRRLAPTQADFDRVARERAGDQCAVVKS
jgi:uncharacterized membrane protein